MRRRHHRADSLKMMHRIEIMKQRMWSIAWEDGYTLLEIILTISILSIALIPLLEMLPRTLLLEDQLEQRARIAFLAQRKMEEVKSKVIYDFGQDYTELATAFPSPDSEFKYTVSDSQGLEMKEIAVRTWCDKDNNGSITEGEEYIELNTKIAKRS